MSKPYYETEEYNEAENELDTYDDPVKLVMEYRISEKHKDNKIANLEAKLAESEKRFVVANNLRKNSDEVLLNYKTKKYGLDKTIEELRKMKLSLPEKEWYYKGFENCERQMSSHIADLTLQVKELKQRLAESKKQCQQCKHLNKKIELNIKNKLMAENCELQKQLAEKDAERELDNSFWKQECDSLQKTLAEKEKEIEYQENMKILAVENQNKKAIERLEKVKELLLEKCGETYSKTYCGIDEDIEEIIGNQINELKEMK